MAPQQLTTGPGSTATDTPSTQEGDRTDSTESVEATPILELLGDKFTRKVLTALGDRPRTGREVLDATDASRPTVYRRLNKLQEAGLVEATMKLRPNGHHCKQFRLVVDQIDLGLDADGFSVDVRSDPNRLQESGKRPAGPVHAND